MTLVFLNRRAQLGKLISIFPIMILIFIIMGVFVLLSSAYSRTNSLDPIKIEPVVTSVASKGDLMERQVDSDEGQESVKKAIARFGNSYTFEDPNSEPNKAGFNALKEDLRSLLVSDRIDMGKGMAIECLVVYGQVRSSSFEERKNIAAYPFRTYDYSNIGVFTIYLVKQAYGFSAESAPPATQDRQQIIEQLEASHIELPPNDKQYTLDVYYYFGRCSSV